MRKPATSWAKIRIVAFLTLAGLLASTAVQAANNVATGDVAGDGDALLDSDPPLVLTSTGNRLALVKRAYLDDGVPTRVPTGSDLPSGTVLKFLIYINNDSPIDVHDIEVRDVLDTVAFTYQADSIKVDNSLGECALPACTAAEEDMIFSTVDGVAAGTDAVDPATDVVSHVGGTIEAKSGVAGQPQNDVAADSVWALSFTVTVN
jgi:hypothetical protein